MQLTEKQHEFLRVFGYLHFPGLFAEQETQRITEEFELTMQGVGGGEGHDGSTRTFLLCPIEHRPFMCGLLDDERILGIAGDILGDDFNYASGDGNYYSGDTHWHPDGGWGQLFACKIAFYLDPLTKDTGSLRVIPGSHNPDHFVRVQKIDPNESAALFGVPPSEFPGNAALETNPGDLVIFNHDLYHAAFGGGTRRRMFTMNLTRNCKTPADEETLDRYLSVHSAGGYKIRTGRGMYYPTMLDTADERRMVHLRQCSEVHDVLFPEYRAGAGS